jgi:hypothetical protein
MPSWTLRRALKMVAADRPFYVGLKDGRHGKWLSIAGGCHRPDSAVMFFQLNNDLEFAHDSISLVLRACLVESLIRQGAKELLFWTVLALSYLATLCRSALSKCTWTNGRRRGG